MIGKIKYEWLRLYETLLNASSFFKKKNFIHIWLTYSVVLGSEAQQTDSVIHIYIYIYIFTYFLRLFYIIGYYQNTSIIPCAIQ